MFKNKPGVNSARDYGLYRDVSYGPNSHGELTYKKGKDT